MKELVIDPMEGLNTDFHTQYESFSYMGNRLGEKLTTTIGWLYYLGNRFFPVFQIS